MNYQFLKHLFTDFNHFIFYLLDCENDDFYRYNFFSGMVTLSCVFFISPSFSGNTKFTLCSTYLLINLCTGNESFNV